MMSSNCIVFFFFPQRAGTYCNENETSGRLIFSLFCHVCIILNALVNITFNVICFQMCVFIYLNNILKHPRMVGEESRTDPIIKRSVKRPGHEIDLNEIEVI